MMSLPVSYRRLRLQLTRTIDVTPAPAGGSDKTSGEFLHLSCKSKQRPILKKERALSPKQTGSDVIVGSELRFNFEASLVVCVSAGLLLSSFVESSASRRRVLLTRQEVGRTRGR